MLSTSGSGNQLGDDMKIALLQLENQELSAHLDRRKQVRRQAVALWKGVQDALDAMHAREDEDDPSCPSCGQMKALLEGVGLVTLEYCDEAIMDPRDLTLS